MYSCMVKPFVYISAVSSFFSSMTQLKDSLLGSNNALVSQSLQEKNV